MCNWPFPLFFRLILQKIKQIHHMVSYVLPVQTYIAYPYWLPIWKLLFALHVTFMIILLHIVTSWIVDGKSICYRFSGHFQYTWRQLQYYPSWFCCKGVEMWTIWLGNTYSFLGMHAFVEFSFKDLPLCFGCLLYVLFYADH